MGWGSGTVKSKALGRGARGDIAPRVFGQEGIRGMGVFMTEVKAGHKRKAEGQTMLLLEAMREGGREPCSSSHIILIIPINLSGATFSLFTTLTVVSSTASL